MRFRVIGSDASLLVSDMNECNNDGSIPSIIKVTSHRHETIKETARKLSQKDIYCIIHYRKIPKCKLKVAACKIIAFPI